MAFDTHGAQSVERAFTRIEVKGVKEAKREITGWATTPTTDRVGDIVDPMGAKIGKGVKLLWQHNHEKPVGEVRFGKPTKSGIPFTATFQKPKDDYPQTLKDRLEEAWVSVRDGLVEFVSIGFREIAHEVMQTGWKFTEWEMLELSLVTIPANAEATINTVKSIDRTLRGASAEMKRERRANAAGVTASKSKSQGKTEMTMISEQISALEADEANLKAQLKKFDVQNMDEADEERFEELEADLEKTRKAIKRLEKIESLDVDKATPVKEVKSADDATNARVGNYQRNTVLGPNKNIPKGIPFARAVLCKAVARLHGGDPVLYAEKVYADDPRIAQHLQKAAVPSATTTASGWASEWSEAQVVANEFIEVLRPMSILGRMTGVSRAPFNTEVLAMTAGTTGSWTKEAFHAPLSKATSSKITLGKTKVTAITALTKESAQFGNTDIEARLLRDLTRATAARIDATLVSTSAAVSNTSPAGLLNGLSAISANGSGAAADIRADLQDLFAPFTAANISRRGLALAMHENLHLALMLTYDNGFRAFPDVTADGGTVFGIPVIASNHVAAGDVIMISQEDVWVAESADVEVSTTDQASLEMLDGSLEGEGATPTGVTTAGVVNLWQAGLIGIKTERFVNWTKGRSAAVAYIGNAGWNGVASA